MERALIALFALLMNGCFGGPRSFYVALGLTRIGRIPAKLLRDAQKNYDAPGRHAVLMIIALMAALFTGVILQYALRDNLRFLEVLLVASLLPMRPTFDRLRQMKTALARRDLTAARQALEGTVWRHHIVLDEHGVARAGIELAAVNFNEKILTPLLCYLLLGMPGLLAWKTMGLMKEILPGSFEAEVNLNRMLFSAPAAVAWVGSRFASLLWLLSSVFLPRAQPKTLLSVLAGEMTAQPSLPYTLFTAASTLELALGGPASAYVSDKWMGTGTAKANADDVGRALTIFSLLHLWLFILLGLFL